ncbi:hypothetical protein TWF718_008611 [Orbilia javanica]|uniref:Uncharacterized protein n=1 Tax=Orbilia javanica TaxID=47235 RepID=A0AAN8MY60_9PEZI
MNLHHRPSIDVPPLRTQTHSRQRPRKRPSEGTLGNENNMAAGSKPVAGASVAGASGRRVLPRGPVVSSNKSAVRNGNTAGVSGKKRVNGSSRIQETGTSTVVGKGGCTTVSNGMENGIPRGIKPSATAAEAPTGGSTPPRISNPPITPTRNHIVHLVRPSPPLSPIKPLVVASKVAVSALESTGVNNKCPLSRPKPEAVPIPSIPPPLPPTMLAVPPPAQPSTRPSRPPNYTLQVSVDLTLKTTLESSAPLPPIVEGAWVNVIGYKRRDGVLDAISIFKVEGKLDIEAYEKAVVKMGQVREKVEREVRGGIAQGKGLQGWEWDR